jgi:DICT domain-containing protein
MRKLRFWTPDVTNKCFRRKKFLRQESYRFDQVGAIYARQVNAITYDENLLDFEMTDGSLITIGETDCGLRAMEATLGWFGVEGDWYSQLERGGPATELCLYRKSP